MGPLKQCPDGHLIMTLSSGPSVEFMMNRQLTSAGSPHLTAPSRSMYAGQTRNMIWPLTIAPPSARVPPPCRADGAGTTRPPPHQAWMQAM